MNRFEDLTRQLIESSLARLFREKLSAGDVFAAIARAIDDARAGNAPAPNHFWVMLNEADLAALEASQPNFAEQLAENVRQTLVQSGYQMESRPRVILRGSPDVMPRAIRVSARYIQLDLPESSTSSVAVQAAPIARCPFLIVDGQRYIHLNDPVIKIGRSRLSDVVVDDRRVSRQHLELRWVVKDGMPPESGQYLAVDMNSTGGTKLNGYPIQQCPLEPGDVLALNGVEMIFGEDCPVSQP
jgi:pSer/pThr/pTyr-binding forkhead associated (FHA) protein